MADPGEKTTRQSIPPALQAAIISEALPHMQRYDDRVVVVATHDHRTRDAATDVIDLEDYQ